MSILLVEIIIIIFFLISIILVLFGIYYVKNINNNQINVIENINNNQINVIESENINNNQINVIESENINNNQINIIENISEEQQVTNDNYEQIEDSTIPYAFPTSETQQDFTFITDYESEEFLDNTDDFSIFSDPMFSDIEKYMNTINNKNKVIESGVEKCLKNCEGNCIEYGVTGIGICFPSNWIAPTTEQIAEDYDLL
jgi:hypothetical protein